MQPGFSTLAPPCQFQGKPVKVSDGLLYQVSYLPRWYLYICVIRGEEGAGWWAEPSMWQHATFAKTWMFIRWYSIHAFLTAQSLSTASGPQKYTYFKIRWLSKKWRLGWGTHLCCTPKPSCVSISIQVFSERFNSVRISRSFIVRGEFGRIDAGPKHVSVVGKIINFKQGPSSMEF